MAGDRIEAAASLLAKARRTGAVLEAMPDAIRPRDLAEAYAVQDRLIDLLGVRTEGWFCACTNDTVQAMLGLKEPYFARLVEGAVRPSPATFTPSPQQTVALECEFGFRLGEDLPPRATAYTRDDVSAAIVSVHACIEIVAAHLANWTNQPVWSVIADNGTDGALVYGEGVADWQRLYLPALSVTLETNGGTVAEGTGARVLGDPLDAFVWLANALSEKGIGLKAGHIHNTGTATAPYFIEGTGEFTAQFEGIGAVTVTVT